MSEINQVINDMKEAIEKIHKGPSIYKKKIFTYIFEKCKDIPDTELYDIIGETFKSNPQNFMKYIHNDLQKKFSKQYGVEKLREMDRYILEKNFRWRMISPTAKPLKLAKGVKKEAMELGLMNLPKYTFYCQPKKVKKQSLIGVIRQKSYFGVKPDIAYVVENWMTNIDPSTKMGTGPPVRGSFSAIFYYLGFGINTFVEITSIVFAKSYSSKTYNANKQVVKFDIYTNNEEYVRAIAKEINAIWNDGMISHLNFKKLVDEFGVGKEDAMSTWNSYIVEVSDHVEISPSAQPLKPIKIRGLKKKRFTEENCECYCCVIPVIIIAVIILAVLYIVF
jgi:hypothetical protein